VEDDVDVLHVEIELEMEWITCIKILEVSDMTWILVENDVDVLHVKIEHVVEVIFIRDINMTKTDCYLRVRFHMDTNIISWMSLY